MKADTKALVPFIDRYLGARHFTPHEKIEIVRIAQGYTIEAAAEEAGVGEECIRGRRKGIYKKLHMKGGASELVADILAFAFHVFQSQNPEAGIPSTFLKRR